MTPRAAVTGPAAAPRARGLAVGALLCLAAAGLQAQPADSAAAPAKSAPAASDDLRVELRELLPRNRLVGKGRLTYWGFQVYDARLWAAPGFRAGDLPSQAFALELEYLRDFKNADVAERSILEMRRSAAISESQASAWTQEMLRVIPDVKKGDRVMGIHQPGVGAAFFVNGKPTGEIRDAAFARLFFGIWLSPKTSEPQLRSALLAGAM